MSLTVRLDETIENELQRYCQTQEVSKSSVVHEALKSWLGAKAQGGNALLGFATTARTRSVQTPANKAADPYVAYSKHALRAKLQAKAIKS